MNGHRWTSVAGYYLGGCDDVFFPLGKDNLNIGEDSYRVAKAFISRGDSDYWVSAEAKKRVVAKCQAAGLYEVRSETYSGGHRLDKEQFEEALDWFLMGLILWNHRYPKKARKAEEPKIFFMRELSQANERP